MNVVYIHGGTYKQRALTEDIIFYCIEKLMPKLRSLEIDVLPNLVKKGLHVEYNNKSEFIDIGTPESLKMASEYMKNLI